MTQKIKKRKKTKEKADWWLGSGNSRSVVMMLLGETLVLEMKLLTHCSLENIFD